MADRAKNPTAAATITNNAVVAVTAAMTVRTRVVTAGRIGQRYSPATTPTVVAISPRQYHRECQIICSGRGVFSAFLRLENRGTRQTAQYGGSITGVDQRCLHLLRPMLGLAADRLICVGPAFSTPSQAALFIEPAQDRHHRGVGQFGGYRLVNYRGRNRPFGMPQKLHDFLFEASIGRFAIMYKSLLARFDGSYKA